LGLFLLAARWVVAAVFLRSGLAKAADLPNFRAAVANYRLLPPLLVRPVAAGLPFAEIAAAVLLAIGVLPVIVAAGLALLLVVFSAAIAINLLRGRVFDCGCAGSSGTRRTISWRHVITDLALAVVAAAIAVAPPATVQLWPGPAGLVRPAAPGGGAFPVLLAVIVGLVTMSVLQRAVVVRRLTASARPSSSDSGRH